MITNIIVILTIAAFLLICNAVARTNLPEEERRLQWIMPLLAIVFDLLLAGTFEGWRKLITLIYDLVVSVVPAVGQFDASLFLVLAFNLLGIALFLLLKKAATLDLQFVARKGYDFLSIVYGHVYYRDEQDGVWLLRNKFADLRRSAKWVYHAGLAIAVLLFLLYYRFSGSIDAFANPCHPVFLVIVLGEIWFFLAGLTKSEYRIRYFTEDEASSHIRDYYALQQAAALQFPDRFLEAHIRTVRQSELVSSVEMLTSLAQSPVFEERLAGSYSLAVHRAFTDFFGDRGAGYAEGDATTGSSNPKGDTNATGASGPGERHSDDTLEDALGGSLNALGYGGRRFGEGFEITINQVHAMIALLSGENIIFASPFFRDYREFLFFPVHHLLIQDKKVLVLQGSQVDRKSITAWLADGLAAASGVPGLWDIAGLDEKRTVGKGTRKATGQPASQTARILDDSSTSIDDGALADADWCDIGILPYTALHDLAFQESLAGFLENVGFVIMLSPSDYLGAYQIGFDHLSQLLPDPDSVTFAAFDINANGLVDALSHAFRTKFVEVSATSGMSLTSYGLLWDADGEDLQTRLLENVSQYLGVGSEIAAFALHGGIERVMWSSACAVPLKDVRWLDGQYLQAFARYCGLPAAQSALDDAIAFNSDPWSADRVRDGFYIVEDEHANLLEIQRQYSTRSVMTSFVNVISGDYLLRDFMRYNERLLFLDSKCLPMLVADHERSLRNYLIELLTQLLVDSVDIGQAHVRLRALGYELEPADVYDFVTAQIDRYALLGEACARKDCQTRDLILPPTDSVSFDTATLSYVTHRHISFEHDAKGEVDPVIAESLAYLRNSYYITEDELEDGRYLGSCLYGHICQRFLPGQFATIAGKYYEVLSIAPDSGMLLRRAADHFDQRLYYRQFRQISLSGLGQGKEPESLRTVSVPSGLLTMEVALLEADVSVRVDGYLRMSDYADVAHASAVDLSKDQTGPIERSYRGKRVLRIVFRSEQAGAGITDRRLITLSVLLNELFRTLYSVGHEYLIVVPHLKSSWNDIDDGSLRGVLPRLATCDDDAPPCLYVIEDSMVDIGLLPSVERNIERFLAILKTYLAWHLDVLEKGPRFDDRLDHYFSSAHLLGLSLAGDDVDGGDDIEGFGLDDKPDPVPDSMHVCDFCGRTVPVDNLEKLKDGRERCKECKHNAIKDKQEAKQIFADTLRGMQNAFDIVFENPISVKFVSAWRLNRRLGRNFIPTTRFDSRYVGFVVAKRGKQVMWLENGRPEDSLISTIAHELTHVWQHQNDYFMEIYSIMPEQEYKEIIEGMAKWAEVQYLIFAGMEEKAKRVRDNVMRQDDEYGRGYRRFLAKYPHALNKDGLKRSPFRHPDGPLEIEDDIADDTGAASQDGESPDGIDPEGNDVEITGAIDGIQDDEDEDVDKGADSDFPKDDTEGAEDGS